MILSSTADFDCPMLKVWGAEGCRTLSRGAFWGLVAGYAALIGEGQGGVSIVLAGTSAEQMALFVACVAMGRLPAMFPPGAALQDEAAFLAQQRTALNRIDPSCIYVFSESARAAIARADAGLGARTRVLPEAVEVVAGDARAMRRRFAARLQSAAPVFVQHSSGTTGIKKAVAITGTALMAQYAAYWPMLRAALGCDMLRIASWLPLYHDMGLLTSLLLPVMGEDVISIVDPVLWISQPDIFLRMIEADGCYVAWMPNFAYRHYVRLRPSLPARNLHSVRMWIDCSEPCRFADAAAFEAAFAEFGVPADSVVGGYAMAETVFAATQCLAGERRTFSVPPGLAAGAMLDADRVPGEGDRMVLSSGRVLQGIELGVLVDGGLAGERVYGEIVVRGACLFSHYGGMDEAQSNIGADGNFRTGDLGMVADGHLYVFGRLKEIIIVNGRNLFAGDIEVAVGQVTGIRPGRVAAFGLESAQTGSEVLIIVAERTPGANMPMAELRGAIARLVSEAFLVTARDIRIVEERWLVKSSSGKVARGENVVKYEREFGDRK